MRLSVRCIVMVIALGSSFDSPAHAQAARATAIAAGTRVRITSRSGERRSARVTSMGRDSLHVEAAAGAGWTAYPLDSIAKLEISEGRHRHVSAGIVLGTMIGAAAGATLGVNSFDHPDIVFPSRGSMAFAYGLYGCGAGAIVGGLLGVVPSERWRAIPLRGNALRVDVRPMPSGGQGLALALRF